MREELSFEIKNIWNTHIKKKIASKEASILSSSSTPRSHGLQSEANRQSESEHADRSLDTSSYSFDKLDARVEPSINMSDISLATNNHTGREEEADATEGNSLAIPDVLIDPELIWSIMEDYDAKMQSAQVGAEGKRFGKEGERSREWLEDIERELMCDGPSALEEGNPGALVEGYPGVVVEDNPAALVEGDPVAIGEKCENGWKRKEEERGEISEQEEEEMSITQFCTARFPHSTGI
ncbi:hypothetical protein ACMD2_24926, partial [Ananas comosus]